MAHFINCTSCGKQYNKDAFEECPFCGFTPNGKTVICPNHLCGKEVSDKFEYCPFCHTLLIKPTKTAEEIINEHKREEEDLKNAIRKQYNIVGDISEEQYKQLKEIYLKENHTHQSTKEGKSKHSHAWIAYFAGLLLIVALVFLIFLPNKTKQKLHGTWGYHGKDYAGITFTLNDECYGCGMLHFDGRYEIDGNNITIFFSNGETHIMRLEDDGCLYASDGSRYEKISEQEAVRDNGLSGFEKYYIKTKMQNHALNHLQEYNLRMGNTGAPYLTY